MRLPPRNMFGFQAVANACRKFRWLASPAGFGAAGALRQSEARRKQERPLGRRRPSNARELASLMPASWNHVARWLREIEALRRAA